MPNFSSLGRLEVPEKFLWVVGGGWGGVCKVIFMSNPTKVMLGYGWGFDNITWVYIVLSLVTRWGDGCLQADR